ncbi:MAG TPA: Hpt domain-containing protein, partial [Steroidobacteraceae bacterium]|nr:Hpt domain-containing protein [Steroidobacteraceae bacterium]
QADRQIKALYESGEERYCEHPPVELLNNLLYYVARSTVGGGRIGAVRASFKLGELLPVDDSVEQERESLSAPSIKLMRTVGAAIKEDLSKVKDVLDIFVRRGGGHVEELSPQLELLKKISDTLGVLGLGELRQRVRQEITDLNAALSTGQPPPEEALIKVAGVLLSVEDSLDDQLVRLILPTGAANRDEQAGDLDFRLVSEAVLRECSVNLARIKEAVSVAVQKTGDASPQGLDNVPQLLRGITAGLLMLGKSRAAELMESIGIHVRKLVEPGAAFPDPLRLERIADAIVSIEYYMETIQSGRNDPWYMLDNAETCVKALAAELGPRLSIEPAGAESTATVKLDSRDTVALAPPGGPTPPAAAAGAPVDATIDPQLLELFIEEAKDEMAAIGRRFPLWEQNPMDTDALATLRRSFHTLKGSGRMVGARVIGELAWSIENLLNRLIDKTLTRTPAIVTVVRSAVGALPQVVEQLETGRPAGVAVDEIVARAYACAEAHDVLEVAPEDRAGVSQETLAPAVAEPDKTAERAPIPAAMDPMLHEIFAKEAATHLAVIREYLQAERGRLPPHDLAENIYRAVHTLCGSSKMAEARHGIRITEPLNRYLRKAHDSGLGLPDAALTVLDEAVAAIENVIAHIDESTVFFADQPQLLERIGALDVALDNELARAEEEAGTSQVLPPAAAESAAAEPVAAEPVAAEPAAMVAAPEGFDREIADIYSEEVTELLESAQASLATWKADRRDQTPVAELQRQLHTLKGGARMTAIAPMGDLSHELETLVIQIANGVVAATESAHAVLQTSLDELARMRDLVSAGSWPPPATALIESIRALAAGSTETTAQAAAAPTAGMVVAEPIAVAEPQAASGEPSAAAERAPRQPEVTDLAASSSPELSLAPILPGRESVPVERAEMARVDADLLDTMLNNAGEVSIFRARLDQQVNSIDFNLVELARTVTRLKEQLRGLE